ncbi:hypothetical protein ACMDCR_05075 [Labrys okinawensis]|uniref:hypothetical protein n=1 Tax=Labrys okinawensis TaxID=346911 RepID=UPI0039BD4D33
MDFNSAESDSGLLKGQALEPLVAGKVPPAADGDSVAASNPRLLSKLSVNVVAQNAFFHGCLERHLDREDPEFEVTAYEHVDAWRQAAKPDPKSIVVLAHVRGITKRVNARNRTELVRMRGDLF